jgi:predicted RNA binding protein YcfA (HicA-like mRNA interferase family)
MSGLPVVSSAELCTILSRKGYVFDHQKGSHKVLRQREFPYRRLTVPNRKEIPKGTLRAILRQAGLTIEEFHRLLR